MYYIRHHKITGHKRPKYLRYHVQLEYFSVQFKLFMAFWGFLGSKGLVIVLFTTRFRPTNHSFYSRCLSAHSLTHSLTHSQYLLYCIAQSLRTGNSMATSSKKSLLAVQIIEENFGKITAVSLP